MNLLIYKEIKELKYLKKNYEHFMQVSGVDGQSPNQIRVPLFGTYYILCMDQFKCVLN